MLAPFDHFLRQRALRHEVRCLVLPKLLPPGVRVEKVTAPGQHWRYVIHAPNDRVTETVLARMTTERLGYKLDSVYKDAWWVKFVISRESRSFTYSVLTGGLRAAVAGAVMWLGVASLSNPAVVSGFMAVTGLFAK